MESDLVMRVVVRGSWWWNRVLRLGVVVESSLVVVEGGWGWVVVVGWWGGKGEGGRGGEKIEKTGFGVGEIEVVGEGV